MKRIHLIHAFFFSTLFVLQGCETVTQGTWEEANAYHDRQAYDDAAAIYRYLVAENNNKKAMFNLGVYYSEGHGVKRDNRQAFDWFLKAAKAGMYDAYPILGSMTVKGVHQKDEYGQDKSRVKCHPAIITCGAHGISDTVWWHTKAVVSGHKQSINDIIQWGFSAEGSAEHYAWTKLAIDHGFKAYSLKDLKPFERKASSEEKRKANAWATQLISLYGKESVVFRNK